MIDINGTPEEIAADLGNIGVTTECILVEDTKETIWKLTHTLTGVEAMHNELPLAVGRLVYRLLHHTAKFAEAVKQQNPHLSESIDSGAANIHRLVELPLGQGLEAEVQIYDEVSEFWFDVETAYEAGGVSGGAQGASDPSFSETYHLPVESLEDLPRGSTLPDTSLADTSVDSSIGETPGTNSTRDPRVARAADPLFAGHEALERAASAHLANTPDHEGA